MRLLGDPIWRGSPLVVLRHFAAYGLALAFATAALAISVLSARPFLDAADVALVDRQLDAVPATAPADEQGRVRASLSDGSPPRIEDAVTAAMAGLEGGTPAQELRLPVGYLDPKTKATPYVVNPASGERTPGLAFEATGALESLVPAAGSPEPTDTGVWLPDTVAARLQVAAGDTIGVQLAAPGTSPPPVPATVTGIYLTDQDGAPQDRKSQDQSGLWRRLADELPVWPGHIEPTTPQLPLVIADTQTYRGFVEGTHDVSLVIWDVAPAGDPLRIADLDRLGTSAGELRDELQDPSSELAEELRHKGRNNRVSIGSGLTSMAVESRGGLRATEQGVAAVRILAAGLSWLVVALATVALLVRRRGERQVLVEQGRSSPELTALSVVEALLPVGVGLLVGWFASPPFASWIVGADGVAARPVAVALVGGVVLATVAVSSAADAFSRHRRASGRAMLSASRVPWRSAVLALAGAGAISAYGGGGEFDAVTAVFPLAAVGAAAIVVSTVATALLARLVRRWLPRRLGPRLVLSRLARDPVSYTHLTLPTILRV